MQRNYIIPIFVPHIGCPNDCVFCNQRKITGISTDINAKEVKEKIEKYLETIPKQDRNLEIAFFGGSFTGIEEDIQKEFLDIAYSYKKERIIDKIRLSTRPDYIDNNKLKILKDRGVDIIELGIQSLDNDVLEKSNRGHDKKSVYNAVELIREKEFTLGVQMMIGLPGDNYEKAIKTAEELISFKPEIARIYPTLIIKDTELEKEYKEGNYKPISLEESIDLTKKVLYRFQKNGIRVIRIGLQPSDNINEGKDVVAGPFHPAFRQLVESAMYFDIINEMIKKLKTKNLKAYNIYIKCNDKKISFIAGQKKTNLEKFKKLYGFNKIKIIGDNFLREEILIKIENNKQILEELKISTEDILSEIYE